MRFSMCAPTDEQTHDTPILHSRRTHARPSEWTFELKPVIPTNKLLISAIRIWCEQDICTSSQHKRHEFTSPRHRREMEKEKTEIIVSRAGDAK